MFLRRKKNKSGSLSIQVVESNRSGYKVIKSFGVSNDESELRSLERKAQQWIDDQRGPKLPFTWEKDDIISDFMSTLANSQVRIHGPELVYGSLYDQIGYNAIKDEMCRQLGVDGVVFGCLNADGTFDLEKNRYLIECSRGMSVTCHRAFDRAVNPEQALEDVIALGFDRILTSGQQPKAEQGIDLLARLNRQADGRIILMAGSGVTEQNIRRIREATGLNEFHFSGRESFNSAMQYVNPNLYMGRPGANEAALDYTTARRVSDTIAQLL